MMQRPLAVGSAILLSVCARAVAQAPLVLTDVTAAAGISWTQIENLTRMGAGGAFLDYDGDGFEDILLVGGDSTPELFRNQHDGTFAIEPRASFPMSGGSQFMCATVGDIDNDGDPDVFLGRFGTNFLLRNDGGGQFVDITTPEIAGDFLTFTASAAFGDYDADGALDLYVANYVAVPFNFPNHTPTPNLLFHGNGDGTFVNVTTPALAGAGTALATAWTDHDDDGDVDLWVCNDFGEFVEPNRVLRNDGALPSGGHAFVEASASIGADVELYCMGIAVGDIDRDLDYDYYLTNLGRNVLLRNDGRQGFTDIATETGTELTFDPTTSNPPLFATSWGCGFHDFDCDGWLDLYVSNGHIPSAPFLQNGLQTPNTLYRHDGPSMTFTEMPQTLDQGTGRGVAFADYDHDGDIDLLQVNIDGAPVLLRNDSPRAGDWLAPRLIGRRSNRDALGARVDLQVTSGASRWVARRELRRNDSYESSSAPRLHFGLGRVLHRIESASIRWPNGTRQEFYDVVTNQRPTWIEPDVVVDNAKVLIQRSPTATTLVFQSTLHNLTPTVTQAVHRPEVRTGYGAPRFGAPGESIWCGRIDPVTLAPNESRRVSQTISLPPATVLPGTENLFLVWSAASAGGGGDQARAPVGR